MTDVVDGPGLVARAMHIVGLDYFAILRVISMVVAEETRNQADWIGRRPTGLRAWRSTCTRFCTGESIRHQQISPTFNERRASHSIENS
jgi:hypothetical protein